MSIGTTSNKCLSYYDRSQASNQTRLYIDEADGKVGDQSAVSGFSQRHHIIRKNKRAQSAAIRQEVEACAREDGGHCRTTLHFEVASYNMEESGRRRHLLSRVAMK